jgi:hypothetical protein
MEAGWVLLILLLKRLETLAKEALRHLELVMPLT